MPPRTLAANGAWTWMLRSYLQQRLHAAGNAIGTSTTEKTTNADDELVFGLTEDQIEIIRRNLNPEERYWMRRLMHERQALDRDLCNVEQGIRQFVADKARKYLAIPN